MLGIRKKHLAMFLSCAMLIGASTQGAYAVTGKQIAEDKHYEGSTEVVSPKGLGWDGYSLNVSFDVNKGKFANIDIKSSNMASYNSAFMETAKAKIKLLENKPATVESVNAVDAKTNATYTTEAGKKAILEQLSKAAEAKKEPENTGGENEKSTLYGKVNLSYADYYYGELLNLSKTSDVMEADTVDKAASLKAEGMYDAVSSSTKSKYKVMFPTTFNSVNLDGSGKILGVKDVDVAIDKKLYDSVKNEIASGKTSKNPLFEIVKNLKLNEGNAAPKEYKIINGDGTLTATKGSNSAILDKAKADISTSNRYGNYGIKIESDKLPEAKDVDGVIIKTSDGKLYAMKHLENIWVRTSEISFAVKPNFKEPHGNIVNYKAYSDMEGKTITEIKYLVRGKDDVIIKTSLLCKRILAADKNITINDTVFTDGVSVTPKLNVPADSKYKLKSISKGRKPLAEGKDYTVSKDKITFKKTANTGIGGYIAVYEDAVYSDINVSFNLTSVHKAGDVKITDNKLILPDDIDKEAYYASISKVMVDGKALRGQNPAKLIFGDNMTANFAAEISHHGNKMPIFTKGENAEYEIELVSAGYPSVKGTLLNKKSGGDKPVNPEGEKPVNPGNEGNVKKATVKIEAITKALKGFKAGDYEAYDIYFVDSQGAKVKTKGMQRVSVTLKNLVPENLQIFHEKADGSLESIPVISIKGKTVTFENDDFSIYYFVNNKSKIKNLSPNTFDNGGIALFAIIGIGAAAIVTILYRKKKTNK